MIHKSTGQDGRVARRPTIAAIGFLAVVLFGPLAAAQLPPLPGSLDINLCSFGNTDSQQTCNGVTFDDQCVDEVPANPDLSYSCPGDNSPWASSKTVQKSYALYDSSGSDATTGAVHVHLKDANGNVDYSGYCTFQAGAHVPPSVGDGSYSSLKELIGIVSRNCDACGLNGRWGVAVEWV